MLEVSVKSGPAVHLLTNSLLRRSLPKEQNEPSAKITDQQRKEIVEQLLKQNSDMQGLTISSGRAIKAPNLSIIKLNVICSASDEEIVKRRIKEYALEYDNGNPKKIIIAEFKRSRITYAPKVLQKYFKEGVNGLEIPEELKDKAIKAISIVKKLIDNFERCIDINYYQRQASLIPKSDLSFRAIDNIETKFIEDAVALEEKDGKTFLHVAIPDSTLFGDLHSKFTWRVCSLPVTRAVRALNGADVFSKDSLNKIISFTEEDHRPAWVLTLEIGKPFIGSDEVTGITLRSVTRQKIKLAERLNYSNFSEINTEEKSRLLDMLDKVCVAYKQGKVKTIAYSIETLMAIAMEKFESYCEMRKYELPLMLDYNRKAIPMGTRSPVDDTALPTSHPVLEYLWGLKEDELTSVLEELRNKPREYAFAVPSVTYRGCSQLKLLKGEGLGHLCQVILRCHLEGREVDTKKVNALLENISRTYENEGKMSKWMAFMKEASDLAN